MFRVGKKRSNRGQLLRKPRGKKVFRFGGSDTPSKRRRENQESCRNKNCFLTKWLGGGGGGRRTRPWKALQNGFGLGARGGGKRKKWFGAFT